MIPWNSHRECSLKKLFLKNSQNTQENICTRVSFLIKGRCGWGGGSCKLKCFWKAEEGATAPYKCLDFHSLSLTDENYFHSLIHLTNLVYLGRVVCDRILEFIQYGWILHKGRGVEKQWVWKEIISLCSWALQNRWMSWNCRVPSVIPVKLLLKQQALPCKCSAWLEAKQNFSCRGVNEFRIRKYNSFKIFNENWICGYHFPVVIF